MAKALAYGSRSYDAKYVVAAMSLAMDNFQFDVTAWQGHLDFDLLQVVMRIAFADHDKATVYRVISPVFEKVAQPRQPPQIEKPATLVFGWHESMRNSIKLPFTLDFVGASQWAHRWLKEQDYGREPDHDGNNSKGWRVFNENWGHIGDDFYAFVAIQPAWAMHGK